MRRVIFDLSPPVEMRRSAACHYRPEAATVIQACCSGIKGDSKAGPCVREYNRGQAYISRASQGEVKARRKDPSIWKEGKSGEGRNSQRSRIAQSFARFSAARRNLPMYIVLLNTNITIKINYTVSRSSHVTSHEYSWLLKSMLRNLC